MSEVVVVETLRAVPGKTDELKKALLKIVPLSRAQHGCLQYDLFEPFSDSGIFLVLMRWKSKADLTHHETSLVIQEFVAKYDKVVYSEVVQTEWTPL